MKLCILSSLFHILMIFPLIRLHNFINANEVKYEECKRPIECGNINLTYPFYDDQNRPAYCGYPGFKISCSNKRNMPEISLTTSSPEKYYLLHMTLDSHTVSVAREDYWDGFCPGTFSDTSLNFSLFKYTPADENVTLYYECSAEYPASRNQFSCTNINSGMGYFMTKVLESYLGSIPPGLCRSNISVPVYQSSVASIADISSLRAAFQSGFELEWIADNNLCDDCRASGGECGYNSGLSRFTCYCTDDIHDFRCDGNSSTKKIVIGVSVVGGTLLVAALLCCSIFAVRRRKQSLAQAQSKGLGPSYPSTGLPSSNEFRSSQGYTTSPSTYLSQSLPSYPSSKSDFENSADVLGVKIFSYNELEEATQQFHESQELGDGGFGTVYYGKLNDGQLVAVKRLYENSCRHMGQFLNEINILARLRHKNLVTLYGCTSRKSRELLLVYEYIPNGTVADHLHGKLRSNVLPWFTRLNIAVETAEALSFLHENDVIHRDVKTTNILLENSFRVKVADFGLSRLFPNNVTHVSTAPQGTPGYVDPEYYQCYQLTEKSDVYSFGVVLAELLSSKVAVDITRHRHDINLANMAVDRIQKHAFDELIDPELGFEKDCLAQKMVKLVAEVAFQCLQQEKDARPSMKEVLESLKGIKREMENTQKQVVVDIHESDDDIGLLKNVPPPLSPETEVSNKSIR
ncbi:LEAF RUST 10 DISEASE-RESISTANCEUS RECEPTOR-LIKE PROTEIN KINASE-like 1.3 isoform X3 [Spinacia oleracea]|uniref:non-specific serine/threonine protein kinase n=1 Tax=Spinacia oleracea TaxID=3562 RepID=A0A9R0K8M0_SPIOL|nr:LEAF RUST 10 DISEASE-RESISTANCE LOCUS RECEPTOR-LIKE PROTEIN KINASE-like 1.3 isoform X3 [Spinacia oleracea]